MGSFRAFVAIHDSIKDCCDTAVAVERQINKFMRYRDGSDHFPDCELDWYMIIKDDNGEPIAPEGTPHAFVDIGGLWTSEFLPDQIADDGELGDYLPPEEWRLDVQDWIDHDTTNQRIIVVQCHD